jgi:hypothetical protein
MKIDVLTLVCCYVLKQHHVLIKVVLEDNSKELIRENKLPPRPIPPFLFRPVSAQFKHHPVKFSAVSARVLGIFCCLFACVSDTRETAKG